jgi:hypothetical protein
MKSKDQDMVSFFVKWANYFKNVEPPSTHKEVSDINASPQNPKLYLHNTYYSHFVLWAMPL